MPSLLDIPRELRDEILLLTMLQPRTAPEDASHPENRQTLNDAGFLGVFGTSDVFYEPFLENRTKTIPTLLVNRQLHKETLAAIDLFGAKHGGKHSYKLDVMLVNERYVWPTWLFALEHTNRIDALHATFRIHGTSGGKRSYFQGGCGGPSPIVWPFYVLLKRFLFYGFGGKKKSEENQMSIKNLELNFATPDTSKHTLPPDGGLYPYESFGRRPGRPSLMRHRKQDGIDYCISAHYLLNFIVSEIGYLLNMGYHHAIFGRIIYERIGKIRFFLDGSFHKEIDLAQRLKEISFHDSFGEIPRHLRKAYFENWKVVARKTRIRMGLPVVPFEDERIESKK